MAEKDRMLKRQKEYSDNMRKYSVNRRDAFFEEKNAEIICSPNNNPA